MSRKIHAIGDKVMLKADLFRSADGDRSCRIVGVLPADHGEAQYRVRLGSEAHERRIVASDIEPVAAPAVRSTSANASSRHSPGESWLNPSSIRIKK
ncbi:cold-shock protein [Shinella sp. S4-D37]|uniref:cold-shock protein n=1 Tax=Shinella sp. S4-D37 TaxID=3161999 RepID=UPI003466A15E